MSYNAPYSGGYQSGGEIYAVSGDFTLCDPCGPPQISYPFKTDSAAGFRDIILLDSSNKYVSVAVGSGYNIQPETPAAATIVIDQDFMVAEAYYIPMLLNTPYYLPWSVGWSATYANLTDCFLVQEGPLEPVGAGIIKVHRRFVNLPLPRNEYESFAYTYPYPPIYLASAQALRQAKTNTVWSRVHYDYYVYDAMDLLTEPLFPVGHRLDDTTGMNPPGIIQDQQRYFQNGGEILGLEIDFSSGAVTDDADGTPPAPTNPSYTLYFGWTDLKDSDGTLIQVGAEIVAEASTMDLWMGNIYQKKTRFVQVR
jgi:hypothetical protein